MYIIPDELLDAVNCDICHKFLSVGPVKVYPDRKTKCGRCSEPDDDGVVSRIKLLTEDGVFKCVNRFDGCNQLLSYSQVSDHEAICHSRKYACPLCLETVEIPTYLLIKHFKEAHRGFFLTKPAFDFNTIAPCTKVYLYRLSDYLFFIECKISSIDTCSINIVFLGDQKKAEGMKQKFTLESGASLIGTGKKACAFFGCKTFGGFSFTNLNGDLLRVTFELSELLENNELTHISDYDFVYPLKKIGLPRKISLFCQGSGLNEITVNSNSSLLEFTNSKQIFPFCFNCSLPISKFKQYVEVCSNIFQPLCDDCPKISRSVSHAKSHFASYDLRDLSITYSCVWRYWGCTETFHPEEVLKHDIDCSRQPLQLCPVPSCNHRAKLFNLKKHFRQIHTMDYYISLFPEVPVSPVFGFPLDMSSHTAELTTKKGYHWVQFQFILVELSRKSTCHYYSAGKVEPYRSKISAFNVKPKLIVNQYGRTLCYFEKLYFWLDGKVMLHPHLLNQHWDDDGSPSRKKRKCM